MYDGSEYLEPRLLQRAELMGIKINLMSSKDCVATLIGISHKPWREKEEVSFKNRLTVKIIEATLARMKKIGGSFNDLAWMVEESYSHREELPYIYGEFIILAIKEVSNRCEVDVVSNYLNWLNKDSGQATNRIRASIRKLRKEFGDNE